MRLRKGKSSGVTSMRASGVTGSRETRCARSITPATARPRRTCPAVADTATGSQAMRGSGSAVVQEEVSPPDHARPPGPLSRFVFLSSHGRDEGTRNRSPRPDPRWRRPPAGCPRPSCRGTVARLTTGEVVTLGSVEEHGTALREPAEELQPRLWDHDRPARYQRVSQRSELGVHTSVDDNRRQRR